MTDTATIGHNSGVDERLKSFVDRGARIVKERKQTSKELTADLTEVIAEAKGAGFDAKILRKTINEKVRRDLMDKDDLDEEITLVEIYFRAAGMNV